MEVQSNVDSEGRNIVSNRKNGGLNQQWDVVYADEWKGEPGKGELNEEFGLYVERDFYVVTQLPSHRYLDLIGANFVIKTPNGRKSQVWYFDQKSLSIKSKTNNQSWNIQSNGGNKGMHLAGTNTQWW
jgi:hypothetical protein